jgi:hypothetical protein
MKVGRLGLVVLALAVCVSNAHAQEAPAGGAFIGLNYSYFATQPKLNTDPKADLVVGAFGVLRRDKALKIQPELQFSRRSVDVSLGDYSAQQTSYFNVGLLVRSHLYKGLYSTQGVQFMIPVAASVTLFGKDVDIKDNVNTDVSLVIGVGHQFGRIGLEGRWDAGFRRIEDVPLGDSVKRNRALTLIGIFGF